MCNYFAARRAVLNLTDAGRAFLDNARAILAQLDHTFETTRRRREANKAVFAWGLSPRVRFIRLCRVSFARFGKLFRWYPCDWRNASATNSSNTCEMNKLMSHSSERPLPDPEGLVINPLPEEPMLVALPACHALARSGGGGPSSSFVETPCRAKHSLFTALRERAFYEVTMAACRAAGFSPRVGQEAPRIASTLSLVAVGLGISLVPASLQQMHMDGVVYRPLKGAVQPKAILNLASRRGDPSAVVRHFLNLVRQAATKK